MATRLAHGHPERSFRGVSVQNALRDGSHSWIGRNAANWWSKTNVTRYDYRYSTSELQKWIEPVQEMALKSEAVIIAFNNHFAGQAVENAEEFMKLLGLAA